LTLILRGIRVPAEEKLFSPYQFVVMYEGFVSNAIGYPIKELPITPERVLHSIQESRKVKKGKF